VGRTFLVRGAATFTGDFTLLLGRHRCKPSTFFALSCIHHYASVFLMFAGSSPPALRDVRTVFIRLWRRILNARGTWLVERCHRGVVRVGFVFVLVRIGLQRAAVENDSIRKNPSQPGAIKVCASRVSQHKLASCNGL
jgi:hypothetical protein